MGIASFSSLIYYPRVIYFALFSALVRILFNCEDSWYNQ